MGASELSLSRFWIGVPRGCEIEMASWVGERRKMGWERDEGRLETAVGVGFRNRGIGVSIALRY